MSYAVCFEAKLDYWNHICYKDFNIFSWKTFER